MLACFSETFLKTHKQTSIYWLKIWNLRETDPELTNVYVGYLRKRFRQQKVKWKKNQA